MVWMIILGVAIWLLFVSLVITLVMNMTRGQVMRRGLVAFSTSVVPLAIGLIYWFATAFDFEPNRDPARFTGVLFLTPVLYVVGAFVAAISAGVSLLILEIACRLWSGQHAPDLES